MILVSPCTDVHTLWCSTFFAAYSPQTLDPRSKTLDPRHNYNGTVVTKSQVEAMMGRLVTTGIEKVSGLVSFWLSMWAYKA